MAVSEMLQYDADNRRLTCSGNWDVYHLPQLKAAIGKLSLPAEATVTLDGSAITKMDTAGAWLINRLQQRSAETKSTIEFSGFAERFTQLITLIHGYLEQDIEPPARRKLDRLAKLGKNSMQMLVSFLDYLNFVGRLTTELLRLLTGPHKSRLSAYSIIVFRAGYSALPIIAILSFMVGVVITYQMGLQLKNYGANVYIVDLLGVSILREFGPLLTAIMVAGRSGSAFTAQLGIMKINQEIDALDTMGVTPAEFLLIPRIVGMVIALPLLTIWAAIMGIFGGMVMSNSMLGITWYDFLKRFPDVVPLRSLLIGLGKTPVFALIIASIGCYQGIRVSSNSDSVGANTTRSVVMAIFFIILADAAFSVILSELKL